MMATWVRPEDLLKARPLTAAERKAKRYQEELEVGRRLAHVQDAFVGFLLAHFDEVEVYFRYAAFQQQLIDETLLEIGMPADLQYRPVEAGARGGHTVPFGRVFTIFFPIPEDEGVIPAELRPHYRRITKSRCIITQLGYALELVKLYGFRLVNSKRKFKGIA